MKSVKVVALLVVGIFLLTGCGSQKLTCTLSEEEDGMIYTSEVIMTFKDDKVNEFTMNMDMKLNDDDMITMWDSFVSTMNSTFEPVEEDGIKISTAVDEDNHAFRVIYEVSLDEYIGTNGISPAFAIPAAKPIACCSAIPISKNLSGNSF